MGLLSGDQIPWRRWWLPAGASLTLFDGLLPDPWGQHTRYVNQGMVLLEQISAVKARVLMADPGMGKSTELRIECQRLQSAGEWATLIDLGEYASTGEIKGAVEDAAQAWQDSAPEGDLFLLLDSFDEPLVDVVNLSEVLARALDRLDKARLKVTVASRGSQWGQSLQSKFEQWWSVDQVAALQLAPLTDVDVASAARAKGLDGASFVAAVHAAGAGPLAARPITLRLMLAGADGDALPANRLDAYSVGLQGLVHEPNQRRRERRRTGFPIERRLAAARRLAAVNVLSGRPLIVRRGNPRCAQGELALDDISPEETGLVLLDDVFDSALLSGGNAVRGWCHHSVAEYLCAQALTELPVAAAWSLLAAPGDATTIRPQLEDTAAWAAVMHHGMFDRLLAEHPQVLFKADLTACSSQDRERVGRALLARLAGEEPLLGWVNAVALDYQERG